VVSQGPIDFSAKLAQLRAERGEAPLPEPTVAQPPPNIVWESDVLLPDLGKDLSEEDKQLDTFVNSIDIIDAYNKWCGKMVPQDTGRTEGIMISCPKPDHPDNNPSAWINVTKQTWFCGGCNEGGDAHDIAAYNLGYPVPGYKTGESFHKLREEMAADFGFRIKKVAGGKITWIEDPNTPPETPQPPALSVVPNLPPGSTDTSPSVKSDQEAPNVSHMWAEEEGEPDLVVYPTIGWQALIPQDTFLFEYMKACTNDDAPEEYHFWHGLMALGLVCGRRVTLDDTQPVFGNLFLCILGATGTGKSRSRRHLNYVLRSTAPYHEDGTRTTGCKIIPVPSSGEYLVHQFAYEGKDPGNGKISLGFKPVTGIVDFDEMSALLSRSNRPGSTLKPTLMGLADATPEVKIGGLQRGDFIAVEPFCSITASTQPKAIRTLLNRHDTSSGFLNRWVFAGGKQKQIEVIGGDRSGISIDLSAAVEQLKSVRGWSGFERSIKMDDDAYERFVEFFRTTIEPAKITDQTDLLKRIDLICKKLMLLLTINLRRESVPLSVVEAVIELYDYVLECYGILNSNIGVTLMQDVMTELQRLIERHQERTKRGASANDLIRYTKRRNYSLEQIKKALDVMTALDIIELEPRQSNMGRPTVRYRVVGE
jgi:hypothetical protein